jgi:hypothetical protein
MPTTRRRRAREPVSSTRVKDLQPWKLEFLLTGAEPSPDTFESLVFCTMTPADPPVRWGKVTPWFELWKKIQDHPTIKAWKAKHGLTYAERLLKNL